MSYTTRQIRPGDAGKMQQYARRNFSVVEQVFISKPKLGLVAQNESGDIAGGAFLLTVNGKQGKVGCIDIIFVESAHRGSELAKRLYHESIDMLKALGCQTIMALVRGDNSQSLRRFEAEGLHPVTLHQLREKVGLGVLTQLFIKTASLAFATGCWILCDSAQGGGVGTTCCNMARTLLVNGFLLLLGVLLHVSALSWWNALACMLLLLIILLGETLGRNATAGEWEFVMPEGGFIPSAIVAMLGGFYPMLGHWYIVQRENTGDYRKKTAAPAVVAWVLLLFVTVICGAFSHVHPLLGCIKEDGVMLLLFYALPFYPFDTFGGKRIRDHSRTQFAVLVTVSLFVIALFTISIPDFSAMLAGLVA